MQNGTFHRMTRLEVACGWVWGLDPPPQEPNEVVSHPLDALRAILLPALERDPCIVAFSGGRDSSAVLAVAVDLARREGLPLPVPVTNVFPDAPETDELAWQELVIRHLGISEWERLVYHGDADLVGPAAASSLRRHGILWPPTVHLNERIWDVAKGGTLITGEGGDEVFGIRRITPLTGLLRRQVHPRRTAARKAVEAFAPKPIRRRSIEASLQKDVARPWLTASAQATFTEDLVAEALAEPLQWDRSIVSLRQRRGIRIGLDNLRVAAAMSDVTYVHPLLEPGFVHSWAAFGGRLGMPGRTSATRALFGSLLPNQAIDRDAKVSFSGARIGEPSRQFISEWDGAGVEPDLVDAARLKKAWSEPEPHAGSIVLLQAAWIASD